MKEIKTFISDHVVLAGLAGSLIWNGIAFLLTFVHWGVNPIFPPPLIMVFPGFIASVLYNLPWDPYGNWQFYTYISIPLFWIVFFILALLYRLHRRMTAKGK